MARAAIAAVGRLVVAGPDRVAIDRAAIGRAVVGPAALGGAIHADPELDSVAVARAVAEALATVAALGAAGRAAPAAVAVLEVAAVVPAVVVPAVVAVAPAAVVPAVAVAVRVAAAALVATRGAGRLRSRHPLRPRRLPSPRPSNRCLQIQARSRRPEAGDLRARARQVLVRAGATSR